MQISVITASYNQGRFLRKCLSSVNNQSGDFSVEHIIFDNCSTDETAQLLSEYQKCGVASIRKVFIEKDAGQTAAINKGFSLASGDIVCWLNTDEWYEDDALSSVVDFFSRNPSVDVVFGDCNFVNAEGKLVKRKREKFFSLLMLLFYGCYIPSCSTFVRRAVIDRGILLDPQFKVTMDLDWYIRIARSGFKFRHIPLQLASFTWHDSNISSTMIECRKTEKRKIQDCYCGIRGPAWFRSLIFHVLKNLCLACRFVCRLVK